MKKQISISAKIKIYGAVLISMMIGIIIVTIYLNQKNVDDALLINISGKQRMLTQRISKDVFYTYASIKTLIKKIHKTDMILLKQSNTLVTMFTNYSEAKISHIKNLQLAGAFSLIIVIMYFIIQLKNIESHALELIHRYKNISFEPDIIQTDIDSEDEIVEISDTVNCLLNKVSSAMDHSAQAVEQSQMASAKLEEITDEFDHVLDEISKTPELSKYINSSEDMVIQSTEELVNSTQKLQLLKKELDALLIHCKTNV